MILLIKVLLGLTGYFLIAGLVAGLARAYFRATCEYCEQDGELCWFGRSGGHRGNDNAIGGFWIVLLPFGAFFLVLWAAAEVFGRIMFWAKGMAERLT
jgi:hypothetical protein